MRCTKVRLCFRCKEAERTRGMRKEKQLVVVVSVTL